MAITSITITAIDKNGTLITVDTNEYPEKPFKFDINTKEFFSFTGRSVVNITPCFKKFKFNDTLANDDSYEFYRFIIKAIINAKSRSDYDRRYANSNLQLIDLYYANKDLIDTSCLGGNMPTQLPKGYIKWLRENDKKINNKTLEEFNREHFMATAPKLVKEIYDFVKRDDVPECIRSRYDRLCMKTEKTQEQMTAFCKMFKNSLKSFSWNMSEDIRAAMDFLFFGQTLRVNTSTYGEYVGCPENWIEYVDTQQSLSVNTKHLSELALTKNDEFIKKQQDIINTLNNMEIDDYIVKVPFTKAEFIIEGNNQSNCVGGYDRYVINGSDFVYFIRKKENPEKSYVTAEYDRQEKKTIQARFRFNNWIDEKEPVRETIKKIDELIKDLVKQAKENK